MECGCETNKMGKMEKSAELGHSRTKNNGAALFGGRG